MLTWTTLDDDATVTVTEAGTGHLLWTSGTGGFDDHVVLDRWTGGPVTVTSTEPGVAAALYAFDDDGEVAGVGSQGATFRQRVAGRGLLTADFATVGATVLRMRYDDVAGKVLSLAVHCSGIDDDQPVAVETRIGGEVVSTGSGCSDARASTDRSTYTFPVADLLDEEGGLNLEVEVVRSMKDSRRVAGEHPGVLLGAALYEPVEYTEFAGNLSEVTVEHSGHLWKVETDKRVSTAGEVGVDLDRDEFHLLTGAVAGRFDETDDLGFALGLDVDGVRIPSGAYTRTPEGVLLGTVLAPPGPESVTLSPGMLPGVTGSQLLAYRLVD